MTQTPLIIDTHPRMDQHDDNGRRAMTWFVLACAVYNICGALTFLVPGGLDAVGVEPPSSRFWLLMAAVFAGFVAFVLVVSSRDLDRYGAFPFWNGVARFLFAGGALALGYASDVGAFMVWLSIGDLILALGAIVGVPVVLRRTPRQLLHALLADTQHDPARITS